MIFTRSNNRKNNRKNRHLTDHEEKNAAYSEDSASVVGEIDTINSGLVPDTDNRLNDDLIGTKPSVKRIQATADSQQSLPAATEACAQANRAANAELHRLRPRQLHTTASPQETTAHMQSDIDADRQTTITEASAKKSDIHSSAFPSAPSQSHPPLRKAQHFSAEFSPQRREQTQHDAVQTDDEAELAALLDAHSGADPNNAHTASLTGQSLLGRSRAGLSKLGKFALLGILVLLTTNTGLGLYHAWQTSPWLFGLYSGVLLLVLLWGGRTLWREWRLLGELKRVESRQAQSHRLMDSVQLGEAQPFLAQVAANLPSSAGLERYRQLSRAEHNDAESLLLFDELVLQPVDKQAQALVHKYSVESALLLAASPLAVLDMAMVLWRNQKMIRAVAALYGVKLGYWSRVKLFRGIVANILYAGISEVAVDLGSQLLSMELAGKLSSRLAQGLGGGMLTARLGFQAMALCRPLPFTSQNKPKLRQMHKALLGELKHFSTRALQGDLASESVERNK